MASLLIAVLYHAFISLGLPDSLLGSAWPQMQVSFGVPSSYAGGGSVTTALMTILSALAFPYLKRKLHTKWIVNISIFLTILGLLGFSFSKHYWMLFLFAVPYGLGAGSIDSALNHYVAVHYKSSVMNYLHCFYGAGAVISPIIMSAALKYARWNEGYRWTAYVQIAILAVCILSLPLWKTEKENEEGTAEKNVGIKEALRIPGVVLTLVSFFSYCAGEATCFLWTSSYFAGTKENMSDELIAAFGSLVFGGLMLGRLIAGFVSNKLGDKRLIRIGIAVEMIGILLVALPIENYWVAAAGFLLIGTGMGPIYPAVQHLAPIHFGKRQSAAVIGLQMASAYVGTTFMPMVFGQIQQAAGIWIMPVYLIVFAVLNITFIELAYTRIRKQADAEAAETRERD